MMKYNRSKKQFLGGFGSENMVEEFFLAKNTKLRPGTVMSENEEAYKIEVGVPFLKEEDMQIELINDKLMVSGEGKMKKPESKDKERFYKGIFHVTEDVLKEEIDVQFNDGLLTITFPKKKFKVKQKSTVL